MPGGGCCCASSAVDGRQTFPYLTMEGLPVSRKGPSYLYAGPGSHVDIP
jgi:hypothetical protein